MFSLTIFKSLVKKIKIEFKVFSVIFQRFFLSMLAYTTILKQNYEGSECNGQDNLHIFIENKFIRN